MLGKLLFKDFSKFARFFVRFCHILSEEKSKENWKNSALWRKSKCVTDVSRHYCLGRRCIEKQNMYKLEAEKT